MREILFRGKRENKWVEGYYIYATDGHGTEVHMISEKVTGVCYPVISKTVGQYTGLTDKNGKKIFEGDIVKCYDRNIDDEFIAVVEFGNPNCSYNWGFQLRPITETNFNIDILLWVEMEETGAFIEIIGNIHDNPELLE